MGTNLFWRYGLVRPRGFLAWPEKPKLIIKQISVENKDRKTKTGL
jgi:hypothetical protein